jgi:glycerophosphoryl diester phosphodiesterase
MTKTLIFAHRGANREAAENTRSAFDKALEYPIDGIETDVQLSRDEVAVLWHDRFLGKVGFPLKHIDDFDHAQLQAMNFAAHFSSGAQPEGIMSLKEFLGAYRKRCRLLLEIKNRDWEQVSRSTSPA